MKYNSKFQYLISSFKSSIRNEGLIKSLHRFLNYLIYGKGVLDHKRIAVKIEQSEPFSEALKFFESQKNYSPSGDVVIYFDHSLGGGANYYREEYVKKVLKQGRRILVITYTVNGGGYNLQYCSNDKSLKYKFEDFSELFSLTGLIEVEKIVIGGIISYDQPLQILKNIEKMKEIFDCNLEILVHDYFCVCPNFTLVDHAGKYCALPDNDSCKMCMSKNQGDFKLFVKNRDIIEWRQSWRSIFFKANSVICFSESSEKIFKRVYPEINKNKITILPHEVEYIKPVKKEEYGKDHVFTIGVLGGISMIKGFNIIREMDKIISNDNLDVKIVVIGEVVGNIKSKNVLILGKYNRDEISKLTIKNEIDIFLVPSICPETFSYTTEEIIKMEFPIAVFNLGAQAERVVQYEKGLIISEIDAKKALDEIIEFSKSIQ